MNERACIIIGAGGGIGRALCEILAAEGWGLIVAGRDESRLAPLVDRHGALARRLDARDFAAVDALFAEHPQAIGAVNLAGSILLKPASSTSADEFDETIGLNLRTAFAVVRAASKSMRTAGGSVVLLSTCAAAIGLPNHEAIASAKAGVEGLVRSAAAGGAASGVRFNAVAPGLVDTPMAARLTGNEASLKASRAMHPLGRIGEPGDVARVIAMLLDPRNNWITGQVIGVDGGLSRVKPRA